MPRQISANEAIRKRNQKWEEEDPSSVVDAKLERVANSHCELLALVLSETLVGEAIEKSLRAAEALTDKADLLTILEADTIEKVRATKLDRCEVVAEGVHNASLIGAGALSPWDATGPLGALSALTSLLTLAFRTMKRIGLSYGFDTSSHSEEVVAIHVLVAATTLAAREKSQVIKEITKIRAAFIAEPVVSEDITETVARFAPVIARNLARRRAFATAPAFEAIVGASTNAWLLRDVGWAARCIFAGQRIDEAKAHRAVARKQAAEKAAQKAAQAPVQSDAVTDSSDKDEVKKAA